MGRNTDTRHDIGETLRRHRLSEAAKVSFLNQERIDTARDIVARMATSEPYDYLDFMFAATLGDDEAFPEETLKLRTLSELASGELVAVTRDEHIQAIGQTASQPLDMEVKLPIEPFQRSMKASLQFAFGVKPPASSAHIGGADIINEPFSVPILQSQREPVNSEHAFTVPSYDLVLGEEEILDFVIRAPERMNREVLAAHMGQLAGIALGETELRTEPTS